MCTSLGKEPVRQGLKAEKERIEGLGEIISEKKWNLWASNPKYQKRQRQRPRYGFEWSLMGEIGKIHYLGSKSALGIPLDPGRVSLKVQGCPTPMQNNYWFRPRTKNRALNYLDIPIKRGFLYLMNFITQIKNKFFLHPIGPFILHTDSASVAWKWSS